MLAVICRMTLTTGMLVCGQPVDANWAYRYVATLGTDQPMPDVGPPFVVTEKDERYKEVGRR